MKRIFVIAVIVVSFVVITSSVFAQDEETTQGQFAVNLAGLLGQEKMSPQEAITFLSTKGISLDDANQEITTKQMADILSQTLNVGSKTASNMDIFNRNQATITNISGTVKVRQNKRAAWEEAAAGMKLREESAIRTGIDGKVELRIGMIGEITIKKNTDVTLESLMARKNGSENIVLNIAIGEMTVNVQGIPPKTDWNTVTPTTLAAVRGTIYTIKVEPAKTELTEEPGDRR